MISREDVARALYIERAGRAGVTIDGAARAFEVPDSPGVIKAYDDADAVIELLRSEPEVPVQRDERAEALGEQLDAMVAEVNANHRIIVRLEERAQNAEALAANLKRLENERAIELMRVRRELAAAEERAQKAEAAEDREASLADLLNSWARESGVAPCDRPEDSKGVADRLWAKLSLDGRPRPRGVEGEVMSEYVRCGDDAPCSVASDLRDRVQELEEQLDEIARSELAQSTARGGGGGGRLREAVDEGP